VVQFDNRQWQAKLKIVYYGPAVGGKTTCLQYIHRVSDPERRTKLYSLNTASDRTLFFDLMSLKLGSIRGYELVVQLYTVPGQVQYQATRKAVLAGADGVVFVADSQNDRARDNVESLRDLVSNLRSHGMDPETIPLVYQFNKRDLDPVMPIEDMDTMLNPKKRSSFPTVAISGTGVLEGFSEICHATVMSVADRLGVAKNPKAVQRLSEQVRRSLGPLLHPVTTETEETPKMEPDIVVSRPSRPVASGQEEAPLSRDDLVEEAVRANVTMTDMSASMDLMNRRLNRQLKRLSALHEVSRALSMEKDPNSVLKLVLKHTIRQLAGKGTSISLLAPKIGLKEILVHGIKRDPLLSFPEGKTRSLRLVKELNSILYLVGEEGSEPVIDAHLENAGFGSALWIPLVARGRAMGLLSIYSELDHPPFGEEDRDMASILAASAAIAYLNARSWQKLETLTKKH